MPARLSAVALLVSAALCFGQPVVRIFVAPDGNDAAAGSQAVPFRTVHRAQEAVRKQLAAGPVEIVVELAPGDYRLDKPLQITPADCAPGCRVTYRSGGGLGKARLLGSRLVTGWQEHRDGVWKVDLPEGTLFHTLYENGKRAHKARFPNYAYQPDFPTARGPYLVTEDGCKEFKKGEGTAWLTYAAEDAPPVTDVTKMKIAIYLRGKCDWMRTIYPVRSIDPAQRRIELALSQLHFGILARARYFLEDELGLLDAPGEFYVDQANHTLYYKPMGTGHPDTLAIAVPVVSRLIEIQGASPAQCVRDLVLDGLALGETDGNTMGWWSTRYGERDGALVWLRNTTHVEVKNCHLKNSGRNGIMLIGHNTDDLVSGCWIEHMGLNGVTLCNRFAPKQSAEEARCANNRVVDCHIHNIGEIHTYASCVNVFNVENNEIAHCELHDSVRYAVTLRGNTGAQYGPPVSTSLPPCRGNRMHHLRIYRCGQDGGDMGALHCANLNNPGEGFVNVFEQITVADSRAVPSMHDIGPDGIFLDWPKMSMDQVFRSVHIIRSQGMQVRSNRPENGDSAETVNVSWKPGFDEGRMDYATIGLTDAFPAVYGGRPEIPQPPAAPNTLTARALDFHTVELTWGHSADAALQYTVFRDGQAVGKTTENGFLDSELLEQSAYRYQVAAQAGDFCHLGPLSTAIAVRTPPDRVPPVVKSVRSVLGTTRVRVRFSKSMDAGSLGRSENYRIAPPITIASVRPLSANVVELALAAAPVAGTHRLSLGHLVDDTASRNPLLLAAPLPIEAGKGGAAYSMELSADGALVDTLGGAGEAQLHGDAKVIPGGGPFGGPALELDGDGDYAEASDQLDLSGPEFTIMAWVWREKNSAIIVSEGNGFADPAGWSFGWQGKNGPGSIALRNLNVFHSTGANALPSRQWTHIAFVRRGDQGFAYSNGKPCGEPCDLREMASFANQHPLRIGRRAHDPDPAYFKGRIADLQLLPYALSEEEIGIAARKP